MRLLCAFLLMAGLATVSRSALPTASPGDVVAKCVGADPCRACKSCEKCSYCRGGKTCGACKKPEKKSLAQATCF